MQHVLVQLFLGPAEGLDQLRGVVGLRLTQGQQSGIGVILLDGVIDDTIRRAIARVTDLCTDVAGARRGMPVPGTV